MLKRHKRLYLKQLFCVSTLLSVLYSKRKLDLYFASPVYQIVKLNRAPNVLCKYATTLFLNEIYTSVVSLHFSLAEK